MIRAKIKFNSINDISEFVAIVSKFDTDIDIKYKNSLLDGKSLQALCNMQLGTEGTCIIHDDKYGAANLICAIHKYTIGDFETIDAI